MKYDFDKIVNRKHTNAMKVDGWRNYLFPNNPDIKIDYNNDDLVKMWIADMDFETAPEIIEDLHQRVDHGIFGYTKIFDSDYYQVFNEWCARNYDIVYDKKWITTSPGIVPAITNLISIITKPDEKVVICTPSYAPFANATKLNNRELVCVPLIKGEKRMEMDFNKLTEIFKDEKVKLFIFCNPYNPNGIKWNEKEITKLGELIKENDMWIISDEIHCDLYRKGINHNPSIHFIKDYKKLIVCHSVSKTFNLAGALISHIIIQDEEVKNKFELTKPGNENIFSLVACQSAYSNGQRWVNELRAYLDENFKYLKEFLDNNLPLTNFEIPDATYLAWVDFSAYVPKDVDLTQWFLQECGILLESGSQFVANGEGYVRLNLACPKAILEKTMNRIYQKLK
ncbi:MAG: PatB family C-S lyase [Bacilli bacterium]|jgi:cystathionine beta-lyase|nr:PatB family C-S lyase [Bacilli bacterium]